MGASLKPFLTFMTSAGVVYVDDNTQARYLPVLKLWRMTHERVPDTGLGDNVAGTFEAVDVWRKCLMVPG